MLQKLFEYLFPISILEKKRWRDTFEQEEQESFIFVNRISYAIAPVAYMGHYFFVDIPLGLTSDPIWLQYRLTASILQVLCLAFYISPLAKSVSWYKAPSILMCIGLIFFQTKTIEWFNQVPYLYSFAFILMANFILNLDTYKTILFNTFCLAIIAPIFIAVNIHQSELISGYAVTMLFSLVLQTIKVNRYRVHKATAINLEKEKLIVETQIELNDILKMFIPQVLYSRLQHLMKAEKKTPTNALDDVLRQRTRKVSILHTDIRNYSKQVNDGIDFVKKDVLMSIQNCSQVITHFKGIQRKIGDLLFCYFDYNDKQNLILGLSSAAYIIESEKELRNDPQYRLKRQIILTYGEATVGNLSNINTCVEITAMGSAANLSDRIDSAIKSTKITNKDHQNYIILSEEYYQELQSKIITDIHFERFCLKENNLKIKDFSEETALYLLEINEMNLNKINDLYHQHLFNIEPTTRNNYEHQAA